MMQTTSLQSSYGFSSPLETYKNLHHQYYQYSQSHWESFQNALNSSSFNSNVSSMYNEYRNNVNLNNNNSNNNNNNNNNRNNSDNNHKNERNFYPSSTGKSAPVDDTLLNTVNKTSVQGEKVDNEEREKEIADWEQFTNAGAAFLGPQLWDKTIPCSSELKIEYMDLDEFLNENNIDDELLKRSLSDGISTPTSNGLSSPESPSFLPQFPSSQTCPSSPSFLSRTSPMTSRSFPSESSLSGPQDTSPSSCEGLRMADSIASPLSNACPESPATSPPSPSPSDEIHGNERFDPRTRVFSEDELKPQPMIKKSRKQQYVPHDMKDDRYWARRRKNNVAAKRSRDARRTKENQIAMRAGFLEKENQNLRVELDKTLSILETMKKRLSMYETP